MNNNFIYILIGLVFATILYNISDSLMPFTMAFVVSYLLNPLVDWIADKLRIKRSYIILLIILGFLIFSITILLLIVPILIDQLGLLISTLPEYKDIIQKKLLPKLEAYLYKIDPLLAVEAKHSFYESLNYIFNSIISLFNNFWTYTKSLISALVLVLLISIISFYILLDWEKIINSVKALFPKNYRDKILELLNEIDGLLTSYIRGQLNICLIMALYYSILLGIIGLDFFLLIGLISGFLLIIPFLGILSSITTSLLISYLTFNDYIHLSYILFIYLIGHILEVYILNPRIIGSRLGLHPVWMLLAVILGSTYLGIIGALIAIPIAGIMKVIFMLLIDLYKQSKFYN
jgi:putative permease